MPATLAGIIAVAAVLRLVALPGQPGGLFEDEAAEGVDALRLLHEPGFHPVFFADDGGREAPFAYLVAAAFRVVGASVGTLRGVAAVLGVVGVGVTYLALRRYSRVAALAGAAWTAGSLWLVCVSRDGMRNVTVLVVGPLALWALLRLADRPGRRTALLAGAACGAGLWTYQPLKLLPLLVAAWLLWLHRADPGAWRRLRRHLPFLVGAYVVVAAPMVAAAVNDPVAYFGRGAAVSAFNPDQGGGETILGHVLRTLGMFGVTGDPNPRHDVASLPLLSPPLAAIALLGAYAAWRDRHDPGRRLLLLGIPVFLLPPLLATEGGTPHFLRSLGLQPSLAGLVGLGAVELAALGAAARGRRGALAGAALAVAVLAATAAQGAVAYFSRPVSDRYDAYAFDVVALSQAAAHPHSIVILDDYRALVLRFVDRDALPRVVAPGTGLRPDPGTTVLALDRPTLAAALGGDVAATAEVVARDPDGNPAALAVRIP